MSAVGTALAVAARATWPNNPVSVALAKAAVEVGRRCDADPDNERLAAALRRLLEVLVDCDPQPSIVDRLRGQIAVKRAGLDDVAGLDDTDGTGG